MLEPRLSVIIPTLNEAHALPGLLTQLAGQRQVDMEVIVADGGSQDATRTVAEAGGARCVAAPQGRGAQLQAGAAVAQGKELLFLHADSSLTDPEQLATALEALEQARQRLGHDRVAGHFALHFHDAKGALARRLGFHAAKSALNREGCTHGDQGWMMSQRFYQRLGGFNANLAFMEDQELAGRIRRSGVWITLPGVLATSARRFQQEGYFRRTLLNALIMTCYHTGWDTFFQRAPELYRQQDRTRPLQLAPFFRLLGQLNREAGLRVTWQRWQAVGRYARQAMWQPFFLLDLILPPQWRRTPHPCLDFYDRVWARWTQRWPFDGVAMVIVWLACRLFWGWYAVKAYVEKK
ncbi:MAG: TIGR04283 family arsenosugar biosynthesis glycosyltransferase [Magnetococcales bacterium]|nr:TIGR04283 family arsenosugar biosynthesis glycosyltransferase [Magnetococcales bacterium]MBF0321705.1 TIGR04283 family arsenosugar biosynthesis glycosyltransferase [Magnetococcales bacterium]